jgi:hypothetical protein
MEKRNSINQPTCISISIDDDIILIRDLNGGNHFCSIENLEKLGKKILAIANNKDLPHLDVGKLEISDEKVSGHNVEAQSGDFKEEILNQAIRYGISHFGRNL